MNKIALIICLLLLLGCTNIKSIAEVKNESLINEQVTVRGIVINRLSLGELSGYVLQDTNNDTISVSSESLPKIGEVITVTGKLNKLLLLGYVIETKN